MFLGKPAALLTKPTPVAAELRINIYFLLRNLALIHSEIDNKNP